MRYKVQFESNFHKWLVLDTAIGDQVMGVHVTETAAIEQACVEESRWAGYDASFLGRPPVGRSSQAA